MRHIYWQWWYLQTYASFVHVESQSMIKFYYQHVFVKLHCIQYMLAVSSNYVLILNFVNYYLVQNLFKHDMIKQNESHVSPGLKWMQLNVAAFDPTRINETHTGSSDICRYMPHLFMLSHKSMIRYVMWSAKTRHMTQKAKLQNKGN